MKENNKKKKVFKYAVIIGLFLIIIGVSYAIFSVVLIGKKKNSIRSGSISLQLLDKNNSVIEKNENNQYEYEINIDQVMPITDENGLESKAFIFKVKNNGNHPVGYKLYLDDFEISSSEERIADKYIKYSLKEDGFGGGPMLLSSTGANPNRKLDMHVLSPNEVKEYELRVWVDQDADNDAIEKVFDTVLRVDGYQYINNIKIEKGSFAETLVNKGVVGKITYVRNGFDSANETAGLYEYRDRNDTSSYVFRGNNVNNYVTFAGTTWRVLRIQEDGTVKLIKDDPLNFDSPLAESATGYKNVYYNNDSSSDEDSKYQGSNIKDYIDEWYSSDMSNYDNKIAMNDYCSDRSENKYSLLYRYIPVGEEGKIYGVINSMNFFKVPDLEDEYWFRDINNAMWEPSISCNTEDKVKAKSALITADEYILSGVGFPEVSNSYLEKDFREWTMSPAIFADNDSGCYAANNGSFEIEMVDSKKGVRPVITLKSNIALTSGSGTSASPYVIE